MPKKSILTPDFRSEVIQGRQDAFNIANTIKRAILDSKAQSDSIAYKFVGENDYQTCKNLYNYIRHNIRYKKEQSSLQTAKTLGRILFDKNSGNDCKHFTIISCSILRSLKIPCKMRLISQNFYSVEPTHIYCVANVNGNDVILDACISEFDKEANYKYKYDIKF
jgi:transglutaminase-like putative cysteine protease